MISDLGVLMVTPYRPTLSPDIRGLLFALPQLKYSSTHLPCFTSLFLGIFLHSANPVPSCFIFFSFFASTVVQDTNLVLSKMFAQFVLVALTLATAALADDNAVSVSTLDFKNAFVESGIVPEVIAALDPAVSFYASYRAADGHDELLVPGTSLTVAEATQPIEFSVENLNNATNITAQTRYLIYLVRCAASFTRSVRRDCRKGTLTEWGNRSSMPMRPHAITRRRGTCATTWPAITPWPTSTRQCSPPRSA